MERKEEQTSALLPQTEEIYLKSRVNGDRRLTRENSISIATAKYDVVGDAEDSPEKGRPPLLPFPTFAKRGTSFRFTFFCRKGPSIPDYHEPPNREWRIG